MNPLERLQSIGQSVWLDSIRRSYLADGGYLRGLVDAGEIDGLTSNPSIFENALGNDDTYDEQLAELQGEEPRAALWAVMKRDVQDACDLFAEMYEASDGAKGYVSIEIDPHMAFDTDKTVEQGRELWDEIDRPNLMLKVPGTEPGLEAIATLIGEGKNVNVTLLFNVSRYERVMDAYLEGLKRFRDADGDLGRVASVASFFVSRVDGKVDPVLGEESPLKGVAGVANARVAYAAFKRRFAMEDAQELLDAGAKVQRPLWASTSVKDDAYSDVKYVEALAGPLSVNTMPEETLEASRDHADVHDRITGTGEQAARELEQLATAGIDLDQITKELETEGVEKFENSFNAAVETVKGHLG